MIVGSLAKKYKKGVPAMEESQRVFEELTAALSGDLVEEWKIGEEKAMRDRGDALRIYDVKEVKGRIVQSELKVQD